MTVTFSTDERTLTLTACDDMDKVILTEKFTNGDTEEIYTSFSELKLMIDKLETQRISHLLPTAM